MRSQGSLSSCVTFGSHSWHNFAKADNDSAGQHPKPDIQEMANSHLYSFAGHTAKAHL